MKKKSSVNINDISTWGLPVGIFVGLIIIAVIIFACNFILVKDVTNLVNGKKVAIQKIEKEYLKNSKIVAILPQIKKEILNLEKVRDKAKKFLPTEVSMPALIDDVYESARKNGIVFTSFAPGEDIETKFYTIKPIFLSTEVGYISMSEFIEGVTALKRIMNIHSVSFKSNKKNVYLDENTPLKMTAELRTYIFKG